MSFKYYIDDKVNCCFDIIDVYTVVTYRLQRVDILNHIFKTCGLNDVAKIVVELSKEFMETFVENEDKLEKRIVIGSPYALKCRYGGFTWITDIRTKKTQVKLYFWKIFNFQQF